MSVAWSQDSPNDVSVTVSGLLPSADVFIGPAVPGTSPPFVVCWPLDPQPVGESLSAGDGGLAHEQWQVTVHGADVGQCRWMTEQVTTGVWPDGWEHVETGPMLEDRTDNPATWFRPITFVYRGMT